MKSAPHDAHGLLEKIRELPQDKVAEVEDFVDFLRQRTLDRALMTAAARLSTDAFGRVWENSDDADYDTDVTDSEAFRRDS